MLWASWDMVPRIAHKEAAHSEVCEGASSDIHQLKERLPEPVPFLAKQG